MSEPTNATNRTINFGLPLFVAGDKPTWLVDWNGTMEQLDVAMQDVKDTALAADSSVKNVTAQVTLMHNLVDNLKNEVDVAIADVSVATEDIKDLNSETEQITQSITEIHTEIDTLSTNVEQSITEMQASITQLFNQVNPLVLQVSVMQGKVNELETWAGTTTTRVSEAELDIDDLEQNMTLKTQQIIDLDGRVTTLEQGGLGGEWDDRTSPDVATSEYAGKVLTDSGTVDAYKKSVRIVATVDSSGKATGTVSLGSNAKIIGLLPSHVDVSTYSFPPNCYNYAHDGAGMLWHSMTYFTGGTINYRLECGSNSTLVGQTVRAFLNVLYYE